MAQWPLIVAHLVELFPTLPHWADVQVFDDAAYDVKKVSWATVGHSTDGTTTTRGHYTWTQAPDGFRYIEQGSVACTLSTSAAGPSLTAATGLIFTLLGDLEAQIRADRTLGVLSSEGTTDLTVDVSSAQEIPGSSVTVPFSIDYYTVT